jgi:hypothetical protein
MKSKSSNKSFGILFFIVFLIIGAWPLFKGNEANLYFLFTSMVFLILGLINAKILTPLNNSWVKLGEILGKIISPIVMLTIFLFVATPIAILIKIAKKDILNLKFNNKIESYWIERKENEGSMKNQF